jgi:hypothetical protein
MPGFTEFGCDNGTALDVGAGFDAAQYGLPVGVAAQETRAIQMDTAKAGLDVHLARQGYQLQKAHTGRILHLYFLSPIREGKTQEGYDIANAFAIIADAQHILGIGFVARLCSPV